MPMIVYQRRPPITVIVGDSDMGQVGDMGVYTVSEWATVSLKESHKYTSFRIACEWTP